ncbi:hypothetical protein ALQ37_200210 [Pseudomonas syringae pv. aptata]|uniref:Uncharacterized protein n=1 Tax=Pseudomonas syringae pv. aptata TaxID=83167 RepID=A0A3M3X747_PSEAP|nr:hypothetical protein [Pseudomonas syringae]RMO65394.1 hypothetical protein ALQ37_200210 [Pseudomonas syringae pv. aptata]
MRTSKFYLILFAAILLGTFTIIINAHAFYDFISQIVFNNEKSVPINNDADLMEVIDANALVVILYGAFGFVIFALGIFSILAYSHFYDIEKKINKEAKRFYFAKSLSISIPLVMLLMIAAKAKTDFQFAFIAMELVHSIFQGILIFVSMFLLVGISMIYTDYVQPRIKIAYSVACSVSEHGYVAFKEVITKGSNPKLIGILRVILVWGFAGVVCKYLVYESVMTLLN